MDDDFWSERTPVRPRHYQVQGEWTNPAWSFEVKEGWEDYDYPTTEIQEEEAVAPKTVTKRHTRTVYQPKQYTEGTQKFTKEPKKKKAKKKRKLRQPAVRDQYEEVMEYWTTQEPLPVNSWNGSPNKWAQACFYCHRVVPVGYGTYRRLSEGSWEATHWGCLQNR